MKNYGQEYLSDPKKGKGSNLKPILIILAILMLFIVLFYANNLGYALGNFFIVLLFLACPLLMCFRMMCHKGNKKKNKIKINRSQS